MAQASIHIAKVGTGSFFHNDRTMSPSYAIDSKIENECTTSSNDALQSYYKLRAEAQQNYTERTGQKMQKNTIFLKEAIINLNDNHTLKDLEPIMKELERKGYTVLQASIHRDEGHIDEVTGEKVKNLHAHITLFNLDKEGKSVKIGNAIEYSKLQTKNAEFLKMERGATANRHEAKHLGVEVAPRKMRLDTHVFKKAMEMGADMTRELRRENSQLQKEVEKVKYDFQETKKQITALPEIETAYKRELHQLNSEIKKLNDQIKKSKDEDKSAELNEQKETKIAELEAKLTELRTEVIAKDQAIDQLKEAQPEPINVQLQNENKMLKVINQGLEIELKEAKSATVPNRAAVEIPQGDIEQIEEVKKLKQITLAVPNTDERNALAQKLRKDNAIDEIKKSCYKKVEEKGFVYTTTKTVLDKDAYIVKLEEREKEHQKLHSFNDKIVIALGEKVKTVVEMTKTALEAVKSKFMGKSIDGAQKERTEPKLSNTDKIQGYVDQLNKPKSLEIER